MNNIHRYFKICLLIPFFFVLSQLYSDELKISLEKFDNTEFPTINFTVSIRGNDKSELNYRDSDFELLENGIRVKDFKLINSNIALDAEKQLVQSLKGLIGNGAKNKLPGKSDLFVNLLELRNQGTKKNKIYNVKYTSKSSQNSDKEITMQLIELKSGNGILKRYKAVVTEKNKKQAENKKRLFIPPEMPVPDMKFIPPEMPDMNFTPPEIPDFGKKNENLMKINFPKPPTMKTPNWK